VPIAPAPVSVPTPEPAGTGPAPLPTPAPGQAGRPAASAPAGGLDYFNRGSPP
jgi:hypothetical protein